MYGIILFSCDSGIISVGMVAVMELIEKLDNGLRCSIDWLSFTINSTELYPTLNDFGFSYSDFYECPKGANGYKRMVRLHGSNLRVLFDGGDNMGIHFDCSGSAVSDLIRYFSDTLMVETPFDTLAYDMDLVVIQELLSLITLNGHISRLDLAIDNMQNIYYRVPELEEIWNAKRCCCHFKTFKHITERDSSGVLVGDTVYLGSRTSELMVRVYNKQLEYNKKEPENPIDYEWVRWELELKDARANSAARLLMQKCSVGSVAVGILANVFRVIVFDDSNKSRCSTDIKWQRFVDGIEQLRLYVPKSEKTLEDKYRWVQRQVGPTLTGLILANHGDISWIRNNMPIHAGRMKSDLRDMVASANPDWVNVFMT